MRCRPGPSGGVGLLTLAFPFRDRYNTSMKIWISLACCVLSTVSLFAQKLPAGKAAVESLLRPNQAAKTVSPLRGGAPSVKLPALAAPSTAAVRSAVAPVASSPTKVAPAAAPQPLLSENEKAQLERVLEQRLAQAQAQVQAATLLQTEKHIKQSLVKVVGRATGELMGSGFVVRSGSGKLYAVVSYHVVGHTGNVVSLVMYDEAGHEIKYNGVVNAIGSYGLNALDAAIIELPSVSAEHARPLKVAANLPQPGGELVTWGTPYAVNGFARADELKVLHAEGFKIAMSSPDVSIDFNGLCGSPVLDQDGKVAGIYSGHDPEKGLVFAVPARKALEWLIGHYEQHLKGSIVFKLSGRNILTLNPGETVGWVRHFSADGVLLHKVYLPQYPEPFDPAHTEKLFSDVRTGDFLEFEIVRHRFLDRMISVEIS